MTESDYYEGIKEEFEKLLEARGELYLEITSSKRFSNTIKSQIRRDRHIIFSFLNKIAPDITGFLKVGSGCHFVIIEIKDAVIELDHIYQVRKYAELFGAKYAFLVSTYEIPVELKELSKIALEMLSLPLRGKLILVQFDKDAGELVDWYERNPFIEDWYWR